MKTLQSLLYFAAASCILTPAMGAKVDRSGQSSRERTVQNPRYTQAHNAARASRQSYSTPSSTSSRSVSSASSNRVSQPRREVPKVKPYLQDRVDQVKRQNKPSVADNPSPARYGKDNRRPSSVPAVKPYLRDRVASTKVNGGTPVSRPDRYDGRPGNNNGRPDHNRPDREHHGRPDNYRPDRDQHYNDRHHGRPYHNPGYYRYSRPRTFYSLNISLPSGCYDFWWNNNFYFEYYGDFYLRTATGYYYTRPPVGVVIPRLPPGCTRIYAPSGVYYRMNDVYYVNSPMGYKVAEEPILNEETINSETPDEFQAFFLEEKEYLFKGGQFFVRSEKGLVWMEPPVGAVTQVLPADCVSIWYQESEYFQIGDTYLQATAEGYQVVEAPWAE